MEDVKKALKGITDFILDVYAADNLVEQLYDKSK